MYTSTLGTPSAQVSPRSPLEWIVFAQIWFTTCRRFNALITHHALAVAMHKADGGRQDWSFYLLLAALECARQFDLEDPKIKREIALHERRGLVFIPTPKGWRMEWLFNGFGHEFYAARLKDWLVDYPGQTAWFYECDWHLTPAQRRAESLAGEQL